ncbi:hypothetical protein C8Q77DRAFT_753407 [Trametes polyzona]|nr:hypothetical protein C8Q77DRAFT_753407 [Trametes polyzona]
MLPPRIASYASGAEGANADGLFTSQPHLGRERLRIGTLEFLDPPRTIFQCGQYTFQWSGGAPPYTFQVHSMEPESGGGTHVQTFSVIQGTSFVWSAVLPAGVSVAFSIEAPGNLSPALIPSMIVQALEDESCLSSQQLPPGTFPIITSSHTLSLQSPPPPSTSPSTDGVESSPVPSSYAGPPSSATSSSETTSGTSLSSFLPVIALGAIIFLLGIVYVLRKYIWRCKVCDDSPCPYTICHISDQSHPAQQ